MRVLFFKWVFAFAFFIQSANQVYAQEDQKFDGQIFRNRLYKFLDRSGSPEEIKANKDKLLGDIKSNPSRAIIGIQFFDAAPSGKRKTADDFFFEKLGENLGKAKSQDRVQMTQDLADFISALKVEYDQRLVTGFKDWDRFDNVIRSGLKGRLHWNLDKLEEVKIVHATLEIFIKSGINPNEIYDGGQTLLTFVLNGIRKYDQPAIVELVKMILDHGADPGLADENGQTPLMAIRKKLALARDSLQKCDLDDQRRECHAGAVANLETLFEMLSDRMNQTEKRKEIGNQEQILKNLSDIGEMLHDWDSHLREVGRYIETPRSFISEYPGLKKIILEIKDALQSQKSAESKSVKEGK